MNEEKNRFLTQRIGLCWHEWESLPKKVFPVCSICGISKRFIHGCDGKDWQGHIDFSTWPGFGLLWEWAIKQEWWEKGFLYSKVSCEPPWKWIHIPIQYIHPPRFADAVYEFLRKEK